MNAAGQGSSTELAKAMGPVACELLGKPSEEIKAKRELRFGTRGSMCVSLDKGTWHDHETNEGGGVIDLVMREQSADKAAALAWLRDRKHLPPETGGLNIVAAYDYRDADGALQFQVCRLNPKDFRQRSPDGAGGWRWKMTGIQRTLYRLPETLAAVADGATIFVCEGEKAVDAVAKLGLAATCSPGGANKWRKEYGETLRGANVAILPDNDEPGRKHAASVAKALHGIARNIRTIELPNLPEKGDPFDWIAAGGTVEALTVLTSLAADTPATKAEQAVDQDVLLTEHGVARAFTVRFKDRLRYCHDAGSWFEWTGTQWRQDRKHAAFSFARELVADANKEAEFKTQAITGKAAFAGGVERFAQRDPAHAVTSEDWDRDPFLLATPGGVVDLRAGNLRPARPNDMMTRMAAVAPSRAKSPDLWLRFLDDATGKDDDLIRFLQQWCGYCLTGDTREHALLFGYGPGGNGKSVFLNTVAAIMGDYAAVASMDTFTASHGDKHPTDLAMFRGARLVTATETEEGRAWAESRIKQMTGGDPISARFMRQDFFTYRPQFKLTIIGNHKPVLKNVDDAARRRFNLAPFIRKPSQPDRELEQKLRAEWPGILAWMIEGCLSWQESGLTRPEIVTEATAAYFDASDYFGRWLNECCLQVPTMSTKPSHLLHSFQQWCVENGEPEADNRRLAA